MGKFITITEIAQQLGLSHSTVSRALSDHPRISQKTKALVQKMVNESGYQVNAIAHQLYKGQSMLIGVIVPDLSIHFFSKVIEGMQPTLQASGYSMVLFNSGETVAAEVAAVNACITHRVDGVLAAISMQTKTFEHFEKLIKFEVPLVFFDRVANFLPVPKVIVDDHRAAFDATQHLLDTGCRRIAHITGSINLNNSNNRLYGYLDALRENKVEVNESLIHYYEFEPTSIDRFLKKAFAKYPDLDGLFVFNDYVANYAVNILKNMGKQIPTDISVIGFSDEPVATYMTPQLSTVQQIATKMGLLSAQKMISILKHEETVVNEKIVLYPKMVLRETTR